MRESGVFLTAEWRNLVMLNYVVDAALLQAFVPTGTELDAFAGRIYLSLVGFEFNRSRVLGFRIPFHQQFEEVNLRFYVRRGSKRGVVFIRELVPKRAVAAVARWAFHENYSCLPMTHRIESGAETVHVEYRWRVGRARCRMFVETGGPASLPADGSEAQFITELNWGYTAQPDGGSLEYEVRHPPWRVWPARQAGFAGPMAVLYSPEIDSVLHREPDSAFLAEGSPVTVLTPLRIC